MGGTLRPEPFERYQRSQKALVSALMRTLLDATYRHVRVAGQMVGQGAPIVMGVREDGKREILARERTLHPARKVLQRIGFG